MTEQFRVNSSFHRASLAHRVKQIKTIEHEHEIDFRNASRAILIAQRTKLLVVIAICRCENKWAERSVRKPTTSWIAFRAAVFAYPRANNVNDSARKRHKMSFSLSVSPYHETRLEHFSCTVFFFFSSLKLGLRLSVANEKNKTFARSRPVEPFSRKEILQLRTVYEFIS